MELLIATHNRGKLQEYREILAGTAWQVIGLDDIGLADIDIEETGDTFEANALLKAVGYAQASQRITLSDDSGLAVDALGGAPGVYSARYGGAGLDDAGRRRYLLQQLAAVPDDARSARFVCVIAVVNPHSTWQGMVRGECPGQVLTEERGQGGFGYDPLFVPTGYTQTFGELPSEVKHRISHRGVAALQLPALLAGMG